MNQSFTTTTFPLCPTQIRCRWNDLGLILDVTVQLGNNFHSISGRNFEFTFQTIVGEYCLSTLFAEKLILRKPLNDNLKRLRTKSSNQTGDNNFKLKLAWTTCIIQTR